MCEACPKVVLSFETDANLSQVPSVVILQSK